MLYGWSITPIMYPFASWFNEASSAYVAMIVLNLFVGITATVTTFILQLFPDDEVLTDINSVLKDICLGFPNYCLGRGLMDLAYNQYMTEYYNQIGLFCAGTIHQVFWNITHELISCSIV
ncbi:ATP-binding cassette sub-family A member 2 [Exaiptasia diaphana]|uniref:ABC-2 type transporter transmembrane domain-containing protein n=1 Tax=Exaiptasia diaphana TaxID=2652724 RepID=A0A913WX09_EXADI|nr:ATP-binding cassette sub-family A member 2 [Exaiptasia diaphana]